MYWDCRVVGLGSRSALLATHCSASRRSLPRSRKLLSFPSLSHSPGTRKQASVRLRPNQVGIKRSHQRCEILVEAIVAIKLDTLRLCQSFWDGVIRNWAIEDRDHPLVVGHCMIDLFLAVGRGY